MKEHSSVQVNASRRNLTLLGASFIASALFGAPAKAQAWPTQPIRLVVPFSAGSILDAMMRAMLGELSMELGQPVILESRPGAGGSVGTAAVARSRTDGHTMLVTGANHNINAAMYSNLPYKPLEDFTPVASVGTSGYALVVNSALPVRTVEELITYTRSKGGLPYPSAGIGSNTHLAMALFAHMAELDMLHIPFKSTGEAVTEVLSGRGHAMIGANVAVMPFLNDSRLRVLGVTTTTRSPFMPEIPTIAESGLPGYEYDTWLAILAPKGTPNSVVEKTNSAIGSILKKAEVRSRLDTLGIEPRPLTTAALGQLLAADSEKMARIVAIAGAKIN